MFDSAPVGPVGVGILGQRDQILSAISHAQRVVPFLQVDINIARDFAERDSSIGKAVDLGGAPGKIEPRDRIGPGSNTRLTDRRATVRRAPPDPRDFRTGPLLARPKADVAQPRFDR
jgi:hypothetical protein